METLQGRVKRARHTTHVSGTRSRTRTEHIAIFEIAGVTVTYHGADPALIERADEVRVAGTFSGERTMYAVGYHNLSRDVVDHGVGGSGCVATLLWVTLPLLAMPLVIGLFDGTPPRAAYRELFSPGVWIAWLAVLSILLLVAVVWDRSVARDREKVLDLLED